MDLYGRTEVYGLADAAAAVELLLSAWLTFRRVGRRSFERRGRLAGIAASSRLLVILGVIIFPILVIQGIGCGSGSWTLRRDWPGGRRDWRSSCWVFPSRTAPWTGSAYAGGLTLSTTAIVGRCAGISAG